MWEIVSNGVTLILIFYYVSSPTGIELASLQKKLNMYTNIVAAYLPLETQFVRFFYKVQMFYFDLYPDGLLSYNLHFVFTDKDYFCKNYTELNCLSKFQGE